MKKLESVEVRFIWSGREASALGDVSYQTEKVDLGPMGHREHVWCDCPCEMQVEKLDILLDGNKVTEPEQDLVTFAEELLMEEADEILMERA
jgi:hypothetical protein